MSKEHHKSDAVKIVHESSTALANIDDEIAGMGIDGVIKATDIKIPQLAIMQPTSPPVVDNRTRGGNLYNKTTGEDYGTSMEFVPLSYWLSRTKFETPDINAPIECISLDGEQGSKYGACITCAFSKWNDRKPPECTDMKNVLMFPYGEDTFEDVPFMFYAAKRKALSGFDRFLTAVTMLRKEGKKPAMFSSSWVMETLQTKNEKGTFWLPAFKRGRWLTTEQLQSLAQRYREFVQFREQIVGGALTVATTQDEREDEQSRSGDERDINEEVEF